MSTVKIEHVNPNTSHPIAFDMLSAPRKDKDGKPVKSTKNPDGTLSYEDGTIVHVDKDGNEIRETMVIQPGHFRIISLSGGLMLHEVSQVELAERERKLGERAELEAEVARERKRKADHEHAEKMKAEREEHKKKIEAEAAKEDKAEDKPVVDPAKPVMGEPAGYQGSPYTGSYTPPALSTKPTPMVG
jgi:cell envelope opacity-associated protein A